MTILPSNISALAFALIVLGDILVFALIALAFRLLAPRRLTALLWVSPLAHLYTLVAVLYAFYSELAGTHPATSLLGSFGAFALAGVVGALLGRSVGHRIPVTLHADGKFTYTGGKLLVALLVGLLLPLALEQAAVLFGAYAGVQALIQALQGAFPFDALLVGVGVLFVLGTLLSITWRFEVWAKRVQRDPKRG